MLKSVIFTYGNETLHWLSKNPDFPGYLRVNLKYLQDLDILQIIKDLREKYPNVNFLADYSLNRSFISKPLSSISINQECSLSLNSKQTKEINIHSKCYVTPEIQSNDIIMFHDGATIFEVIEKKSETEFQLICIRILKPLGEFDSLIVKNNNSWYNGNSQELINFIHSYQELPVDGWLISFVENYQIIDYLKNIDSRLQLFAKIETPLGLDNLELIANSLSNIILARGDLSNFYNSIELKKVQSEFIQKCNKLKINYFIGSKHFETPKECISFHELNQLRNMLSEGVPNFLFDSSFESFQNKNIIKTLIV